MEHRLKILKRIFPKLPSWKYSRLQTDIDSVMYITRPSDADKITDIICESLNSIGLSSEDCTITDATGNIGGNTISFAKSFARVVSVEINEDISKFLRNNVNVYNLENVTVINDDFNNLTLNQDALFIDPPWGGLSYKNQLKVRLMLGKYTLEEVCNKVDPSTKLIALKLPFNYDIEYFINMVKYTDISIIDIGNIKIIIILT